MIKPTRAFVASDGTVHTELSRIQEHEIKLLLRSKLEGDVSLSAEGEALVDVAAKIMVQEREKVLDILTTSSRSRPATRKINGASRKPRATTPKAPTAS
jgi:hypothetical protein